MGMNTFNTSVPQTHPDMQVDHAMSYNNMYYLIAAAEAMGDEGLTGNNIPTAMPLFMFAVIGLLRFTKITCMTPHHHNITGGNQMNPILKVALHVQIMSAMECVCMDVGGVGRFSVVIAVTMLAASIMTPVVGKNFISHAAWYRLISSVRKNIIFNLRLTYIYGAFILSVHVACMHAKM